MNDLSVKIATLEIQIMSIKCALDSIVKAIHPKNALEEYDKWQNECENIAKEMLNKQKESEGNDNE